MRQRAKPRLGKPLTGGRLPSERVASEGRGHVSEPLRGIRKEMALTGLHRQNIPKEDGSGILSLLLGVSYCGVFLPPSLSLHPLVLDPTFFPFHRLHLLHRLPDSFHRPWRCPQSWRCFVCVSFSSRHEHHHPLAASHAIVQNVCQNTKELAIFRDKGNSSASLTIHATKSKRALHSPPRPSSFEVSNRLLKKFRYPFFAIL